MDEGQTNNQIRLFLPSNSSYILVEDNEIETAQLAQKKILGQDLLVWIIYT